MAYKEVKDDNPNEEDGSEIWKPEAVGEFLEGIYTELEEEVGIHDSNLYSFDSDGTLIKVWGSKVLDGLMNRISIGSKVKVVFDGIGKGKKQRYKKYRVFVDDEAGEDTTTESTQGDDVDGDALNEIEHYMDVIRKVRGKEHNPTAVEIINVAEAEELKGEDMERLKLQLAKLVKAGKIADGGKKEE
jgi:hypothetical protein